MREVLSWEMFGAATRELAASIAADGSAPEVVVSVARGGLLPGGALAYALGIKAVGTINVEFYSGEGTTLPDPVVLEPHLDTGAIDGKRVLLVDDVADTGRTLEVVGELLAVHTDRVQSAVLYTKPSSVFAPDFSWKTTAAWIDFPWSTLPEAVRL